MSDDSVDATGETLSPPDERGDLISHCRGSSLIRLVRISGMRKPLLARVACRHAHIAHAADNVAPIAEQRKQLGDVIDQIGMIFESAGVEPGISETLRNVVQKITRIMLNVPRWPERLQIEITELVGGENRGDSARSRRSDNGSWSAPGAAARPAADEQDGYVPNVVYSCGALVHAETLLLPYGIADSAIGVATVPLPELLPHSATENLYSRPASSITLLANSVDIASSRAFTKGPVWKPPSAASRQVRRRSLAFPVQSRKSGSDHGTNDDTRRDNPESVCHLQP